MMLIEFEDVFSVLEFHDDAKKIAYFGILMAVV